MCEPIRLFGDIDAMIEHLLSLAWLLAGTGILALARASAALSAHPIAPRQFFGTLSVAF